MKKLLTTIAFALLPLLAFAQALDVNGGFTSPNAEGIPARWMRNAWQGYLPTCKLETIFGGAPGGMGNSLKMSDVQSARGAAFNSQFYPGKQGQTLNLTFQCRGNGTCVIKLFFKTTAGEWNFESEERVTFEVSPDWQPHQCAIPIQDGRAGETGSFDISMQISQGGELEVANFGATLMQTPVFLKTATMDFLENFDDDELLVTGTPELFQDYPTQGLLVLTGQATYQTTSSLTIKPKEDVAIKPHWEQDLYHTIGLRVQNFGRGETATTKSATLSFRLLDDAGHGLEAQVQTSEAAPETLLLQIVDAKHRFTPLAETTMLAKSLPADFLFGIARTGEFTFQATSLLDGSVTAVSGKEPHFRAPAKLSPEIILAGKEPEVTVDNFLLGTAFPKGKDTTPPFQIDIQKEFDPVMAGWPLVFADEFDGDTLDLTKWKHGWQSHPENVLVHDGLLEIRTDWNPEHTELHTGAITGLQNFQYGYFEGRFKFRHQPGWWSAFWLYGDSNANPFYDGFEIDIYEDYFLTELQPGVPARHILDHNLHVYCGETLKSWNYNGPKMGSLEDFYVIGCKWTPFEISYYMNGKLIESTANHSPYKNIIFDAFRHACGLAPIHPIVSGHPKKSAGDPNRGVYPESFYCDYVRVYAYPQENLPQVEWTKTPAKSLATYGETLEFSVAATPNAQTGSPIKNAYLFDGGYLVAHKDTPPFDFKVILSKEFYDTTDYNRPGRQGIVPDFDKNLHAYSVFVQDEAGKIAHTPLWVLGCVLKPGQPSTPFAGKAQTIPGRLNLVDFDEGGQGVAYLDITPGNTFAQRKNKPSPRNEDVDFSDGGTIGYVEAGEWLNYTVDIQEEGTYRATMPYGTPAALPFDVKLYLDDQTEVANFVLTAQGARNHEMNKVATTTLHLPAGTHRLKLLFLARPNVKYIDFEKLAE